MIRLRKNISINPAVLMRFLRKIAISDKKSCWLWIGCTSRCDKKDYGDFKFLGKMRKAHRVSFYLYRSDWVPGMHIDHLCRNTLCVNSNHLEQVTPKQNILRGIGRTAINAKKKICIRGHKFDSKNTYIRPDIGHRQCKRCRYLNKLRYKKGRVHG